MLNIISQVSYSVQNPCPDTPSSSPRPNLHQLFFSDHAHVRGLLLDHWLALKLSQSFFLGAALALLAVGFPLGFGLALAALLLAFAFAFAFPLAFALGGVKASSSSSSAVLLLWSLLLLLNIWLLLVVTVCLQS